MSSEIESEGKSSEHGPALEKVSGSRPSSTEKQPHLSEEEIAYPIDGIKLLQQVIEERTFCV